MVDGRKKKSLYLNVIEIIFRTAYFLFVAHSGLLLEVCNVNFPVLDACSCKCVMWLRV
jgi:hypothetical protein